MKKLTIIALISFILFSCKEDDAPYPPTLGAGTVTITKEAQTVKIPIVAEMEILDVIMPESAEEWCSYEWSQFEIIVTVAANNLIPREVTFTLKAQAKDGVATLKQEGRNIKDFKQYDIADWEVAAVSDEIVSDGGGASSILNLNDPHGTFWHSDWSIGAPLPHWIVIDMKKELEIDMIQLGWRKYGEKYYYYNKITEVYVGNNPDPAQITNKVGSLKTLATAGNSSDQYQPYHNVGLDLNKGRYLKLVVTESNNGQNSIIAYVKAFKYEGAD
ncbi:MAG: discoidin domain-containing protein [Prevotella sp.]|jgi:hypothetical protein|nr:discoidin domain-containing protein [Prevotella sp.]